MVYRYGFVTNQQSVDSVESVQCNSVIIDGGHLGRRWSRLSVFRWYSYHDYECPLTHNHGL